MLDIDNIKKLIEMMVAHDLVEISLRDGEEEVNLRRPHNRVDFTAMTSPPGLMMPSGESASAPAAPSGAPAAKEAQDAASEVALLEIASPMVGTFYASPDPDSSPYVTPGTQVYAGMVVCILEAMKVFNEIKSEVAGTIERVLVENGKPVEYGQPLFQVRPL